MTATTSRVIRRTRSVCPTCGQQLEARLVEAAGEKFPAVYMEKTCPQHGQFRTPLWRGWLDQQTWRGSAAALPTDERDCAHCAGLCAAHQQGSCCVLLEVTPRCDLSCAYCFAHGGESAAQPAFDELCAAMDYILTQPGPPLLQLSGGEPTQRDDLPQLIAYARQRGAKYVQLNSNGLRLSADPDYARELKRAGLSFVFMQFDGVDDAVYRALRGRPLLAEKMQAIDNCGQAGLGVTLVPTVVRGVNDAQLGDVLRLATALSPVVRGVHFQPVAFLGRYPAPPPDDARFTLDELLHALFCQGGLDEDSLLPSRCDHPLCGCHGSFLVDDDLHLVALSSRRAQADSVTTAEQNREYVGRRWLRQEGDGAEQSCCCADKAAAAALPDGDGAESCCCGAAQPRLDLSDMEQFAARARSHSFTVSAMCFQDAGNLDIERLRRCSLHVYDHGRLLPFCSRYGQGEP